MEQKKELVWVDAAFAEKYKALENKANQREIQIEMFNEYMKTVSEKAQEDFKCNLESLEEDAAMYTGLMLKVKKTFENASNASLDTSYKLWEEYDKKRSETLKQVNDVVSILKPLELQLKTVNELASKLNTWNIDNLVKSLQMLTSLTGENKEMMTFLVENYKAKDSATKRYTNISQYVKG